jgi:uncharacterized protein (TIGR03032 family)
VKRRLAPPAPGARAARSALDDLWAHHNGLWRDSRQVVSQWRDVEGTDPALLAWRTRGEWWETLARARTTLLVTREYEHLVVALSVTPSGPLVSYLPLPHPSGLVVDRGHRVVHIASTRNPNQLYELRPVTGALARPDSKSPGARRPAVAGRPLVPVRSTFLPGCLYLHDLSLIGGRLHANAVGHNAVVRFDADGRWERVWWPRSLDRMGTSGFERNHLQLNSIAAGKTLADSFFSASAERPGPRRPGQASFPVKERGVVFSGRTREPIARGLTRPHSARLHRGRLWVANSGYGEVGTVEDGEFHPIARIPSWTRGLALHGTVAFVGGSRVIPRFRQYAPGLDTDASECGVHALDTRSGRWLGSLVWPRGNQVFAIDWIASGDSAGFPFVVAGRRSARGGNAGRRDARRREARRESGLFYSFEVNR